MKKLLVVLVLLCTFGGLLFADDFTNCLNYIDKKLDASTVATIQSFSANLTESEKYVLFQHNKKDGAYTCFINGFVGFGIGSFVQGDTTGGVISLVADLAGYAMFFMGYEEANLSGSDSARALYSSGLLIVAINKIFTCIRPFTYANGYNKRLSKALYGTPTVALVPSIDEIGNTSWTFSTRIDF